MHDKTFSSATTLAAELRAGTLSSSELTEHYIERIERLDGDVNAVVVRCFDQARQAMRPPTPRWPAASP